MARRKPNIQTTPAWPIFAEMVTFCKDGQVLPCENAFYEFVLKDKYKDMTKGRYRYHFGELVKAGFIRIEPKTRAVRIVALTLIENELMPDF